MIGMFLGLRTYKYKYLLFYLKVEVAFAQFDSSGDDRLDYREFCEMCNKKKI